MRNVTLTGTNIGTSALGFGTSSLMGKLDKKASLRLLEVAYENGIRHFDTAPSYGYGEAETVLGEFSQRKTDVTLATKFGRIQPQTGSLLFRRVKSLARPLLRMFPGLRGVARNAVQARLTTQSDFNPITAAASLERSLRQLRRDRIELLLLHECRRTDLLDDGLLDFLTTQQSRGLIALFGIATDIATIDYCVDVAPSYTRVIQLANNAAEPNLAGRPALPQRRLCVTHSPFGGFGRTLRDRIPAALSYAAGHNPAGIILFSSQHEAHIVANVAAFM